MRAIQNIQQFSNAFISAQDLRGSILAKRVTLRTPDVTFKSKAKEVLQKTSVLTAFAEPQQRAIESVPQIAHISLSNSKIN